MKYAITWDLDSLFEGGIDSTELSARLILLDDQIKDYARLVGKWDTERDTPDFLFLDSILALQELVSNGFGQTISFVNAIQSADVNNKKAGTMLASLYSKSTDFENANVIFTKKLTSMSEASWNHLKEAQTTQRQGVMFILNETREQGKRLLSENEENIINQLSTDGFNAWSTHYDTLVSQISIPFTEKDGTEVHLSAGQAFNKMTGDADSNVRAELFEKWEQAWSEKAPLFADTLNHLDGFRLTANKLHGITNHLQIPLEYNRMKEETLNAMWGAISDNKQPFVDFLERKAKLFGKEKMEWQDQDAPIILGDFKEKRYTFDEAADFIVENFRNFSPKMADFAQMAFDKSWIEAEDRPGKRPGGYCTSLPENKESRIFMTYGESINEVSTLAHELGHAYHSHVMWDLPAMSQDYAMNVAETASTFAELIVADATLKQATTNEEKINLIDVKMQNAIAMFMNIHTRFIFENNLHEARKENVLTDEEITELMLAAQKESYCDSLGSYHPHFWASKLHFFIDDVPFYNFPYTFGYLFSLGIYAHAQKQGASFEDEYIALLQDTASMTTEELAKKHLGIDLTKPDFWQDGINIIKKDVEEFLTITESYI
ncbi:M3 family oligoendopeptidase [Vagococcus fluvialis]|uniref:M3 family oligoendopeptidase n=1 Tax=Vagococcus fluvialis TaxID=2738 RepID=UPI001A8F8E54|nr:M3 family oligoendopeptidase [Vagococcus fluvialis]MBO0478494.1 M3 family oligoendopeptidase [Vagococcus fluvialis]MBO0484630.1 M3 family oligoendopeptidase [Vagococcus fluvialis]MBO0486186.1 M3 family oligoendopeptidase [Vagococcus fluvialis]UDM70943.1 M3 family oligoendopeptidase [Vagococcus fluvialis]UDM74180.1 M3 family oligoendopeptidase [Vagococcus fluvialis]